MGYFLVLELNDTTSESTSSSKLVRLESTRYDDGDIAKCKPVKNIAYLKVHKTGSTAIQLILLRYGLKHDLHFAFPKSLYVFNLSVPFDSKMIHKESIGDFEINIFAIHCKWNFEEIKSVMPNDTIYIASVREPLALFESMFHYSELGKPYKMNIDDYIANISTKVKRGVMGYNLMAWDFGLLHEQIYNQTAVENLIKRADEYFDLVLVAENFDESLVLMRRLLCWTYDDVVTLKINARSEKYKHKIKETTLSILKEKLWPDILIYNHFRRKFDQLVQDFGRENMIAEMDELRRVRQRTKEDCNLTEVEDIKSEAFRPYSNQVTGWNGNTNKKSCVSLMYHELYFVNLLRKNQESEVQRKLKEFRKKKLF